MNTGEIWWSVLIWWWESYGDYNAVGKKLILKKFRVTVATVGDHDSGSRR